MEDIEQDIELSIENLGKIKNQKQDLANNIQRDKKSINDKSISKT